MQDEGTLVPNDVTSFRHRDWAFGVSWIATASGPNRRKLWAVKDGITLSAWCAPSLSELIRQKETAERLLGAGWGIASNWGSSLVEAPVTEAGRLCCMTLV